MPAGQSIGWKHWILLAMVLFLALAVRTHDLGRNSLWADEFLSLECSNGWARADQRLAGQTVHAPDLISRSNAKPWTSIWSSISTDENHPPLYFILLRGWRTVFGDSATALRAMSVTASIACLILLFWIGVSLGSPGAGLWACLLMAVAGPQVEQAQDARSYMPMLAALLAAALALVQIDRMGPNWRRCAMLGVFTLIAPLIHYMALASIAAMLIYALVGMRAEARRAAVGSICSALLIYALVWGPSLVIQHHRMVDDTHWLMDDHPNQHSGNLLVDLLSLPARLFLKYDFDDDKLSTLWLGGAALLLPVLLYRKHRPALLWGIWFLVPVLVVAVIDIVTMRRSMGMAKYTIAAAPAIFLMLGLLATHVKRVGSIPAVIIACSCLVSLPALYATPQPPDWRELAAFVNLHTKPNDPVLFVDTRPDNYCSASLLSAEYYLRGSSHPLYVVDRPPTGEVLKSMMKVNHACVIAADSGSLRQPIIPGLAIDHGELLPGIAVAATIGPPKPMGTVARKIQ